MASAQVKSGILLAGLWAAGETSVTEPEPTRDHTERMLRAFGYDVKTEGNRISLQGGGKLVGTEIQVPSDISSAAFFMVGAAITEGSDVTLEAVGINPTRTGVIEILKQMGADITVENERIAGGEPIADIRIQGTRTLKGSIVLVFLLSDVICITARRKWVGLSGFIDVYYWGSLLINLMIKSTVCF
jgi:3-phosphoshikimate 1-carboxyvinyltransferase